MFLNKHNLIIEKLACKEQYRGAMCGIAVTKEETVATDAKRLVVVKLPKVDPNDFPKINKLDGKSKPEGVVILSAETIKSILSIIPKKQTKDILENVLMDFSKESPRAGTTNLAETKEISCTTLEGKYPAYKEAIPKTKPVLSTSYNINMLYKILDLARKFNPEQPVVNISFHKVAHNKAYLVKLEGKTNKGQDWVAILMPIAPPDNNDKEE